MPAPPRARDVLVLCYHAVSETWSAALSVTPQAIERQLRRLVARGYRACTFTEAVLAPPAPKTLAITFDDAFASVAGLALPIIERLGLCATVFVPTCFPEARPGQPMGWPGIDGWLQGPHEDELRGMSWDQLRGLARAGWEIGSHTHTHPRLTTLADEALAEELATSKRICAERMGADCTSLAYPYGDHDERVVRAAGAAGYAAAGTLPGALHPATPLRWPRVGVYHADHGLRLAAKTSPLVRRVRGTVAR
jgi:peptidoglycan/xylan/chitin deacetylase (PgdA/CDA1 family)